MSLKLTSVARDLQDIEDLQVRVSQSEAYYLAASGELSDLEMLKLQDVLSRRATFIAGLTSFLNKLQDAQQSLIDNMK
jgi:hypothetical protein